MRKNMPTSKHALWRWHRFWNKYQKKWSMKHLHENILSLRCVISFSPHLKVEFITQLAVPCCIIWYILVQLEFSPFHPIQCLSLVHLSFCWFPIFSIRAQYVATSVSK
jgi:hypothetical protein